jgi:oligopeptide/dipeptide ABC transporter ATP-binding protein
MSILLEARAVTKLFGGGLRGPRMTAVDDFSLAIADQPPSITALVGESGSGKTTLARLLLGLIEPSDGAVLYKGADIRTLSGADLRAFRRDVQVIFQDPFEAYNPFYRVDHVLETPLMNFGLAGSRREARRMIEETLRAVGLRPEETLGRYPHQLSGGQRQRIMVARALLIRPRVIIADEPVSMVDASLRATILTSLRELHDNFGISLIYITHDLTTAYQISQNVIVLYRGLIAEAGDVEKVVGDPKHPYTRLLIGSIPYPDPDRPWKGEEAASAEGAGGSDHGCRFAQRCPAAMAICRDSPPPLFRVDRRRAAACYLYRDDEVVAGRDIGTILDQEDDLAPERVGVGVA